MKETNFRSGLPTCVGYVGKYCDVTSPHLNELVTIWDSEVINVHDLQKFMDFELSYCVYPVSDNQVNGTSVMVVWITASQL